MNCIKTQNYYVDESFIYYKHGMLIATHPYGCVAINIEYFNNKKEYIHGVCISNNVLSIYNANKHELYGKFKFAYLLYRKICEN